MTSVSRYTLELTIKEGLIDLFYVYPDLLVETAVDGVVDDGHKTAVVRMSNGQASWNKSIILSFSTLEPTTPVIISMSMLRKQLLQQGFMLIGTARFSISELIPILNKGSVERKVKMNMIKGVPVTGSLVITLDLKDSSTVEVRQDAPALLAAEHSKTITDGSNISSKAFGKYLGDNTFGCYTLLIVICVTIVCGTTFRVLY